MSDKITRLHIVAPPTTTEEIRAEVIAELERTLEDARRGDIDEIFMILKHPGDDEWSHRATPTQHLTAWIGKLEVTKLAWADNFRKNDNVPN
jgi:hypothetical protein